jgi:hypothetical protein
MKKGALRNVPFFIKEEQERFANPNIFIIFVVKYDESDFFRKEES